MSIVTPPPAWEAGKKFHMWGYRPWWGDIPLYRNTCESGIIPFSSISRVLFFSDGRKLSVPPGEWGISEWLDRGPKRVSVSRSLRGKEGWEWCIPETF